MASATAGHYVLGTEGLALLRRWLLAEAPELERRVEGLKRLLGASERGPMQLRFEVPLLDPGEGYARWSSSYDTAPNPLIRAEQGVVRGLIDASDPGIALDAACGTGRHAAYLCERGHDVIGVDASPEMLERARKRVPEAELRAGDLTALPLEDRSVDLAVCALALTHLPELLRPLAELSRVLRPGGRLILSDLHPAMTLLGGTGFFIDADGVPGNVRSFHHSHAGYLAAFRASGLDVVDCIEPAVEEQDLAALSGGLSAFAEEAFRSAWLGLPNALVWDLRRRA